MRYSRSAVALSMVLAAVLAAVVWALSTGSARAQGPEYCIPPNGDPPACATPTPTGTPGPNPPSSGPRRMSPFPRVRTAGSFTRNRTRFTRIIVKAPKGARISARCSKRRCRPTRRIAGPKRLRLKRQERSYKPKTTITIRTTNDTEIGKYVEIRTRRGKAPRRRDRCLRPGKTKPVSCD